MNVLISGCTRGIGYSVATILLNAGWDVFGVSRNEAKLVKMMEYSNGTLGNFNPILIDLCSHEDVIRKKVNQSVSFEDLDALINNFGGTSDNFGAFLDLEINDWQKSFDVNVKAAIVLSKLFIEKSTIPKRRSIIFLSSVAGVRPGKYNPHYGFMKAGIIHFSKGLAHSFGHLGFTVNCVSPSQLDDETFSDDIVDFSRRSGKTITESRQLLTEELMKKRSLKYFGSSEEVAYTIEFLLSEKAKLISGQNIIIDCAGV